MPKKLGNKLKQEAKRKHLGKKRTNAYVYGTLQRVQGKRKKKSL